MTEPVDIAEFVCATLALACRKERGAVDLRTNFLELNVDSLTLVSVLAQVEAVYAVELTPNQLLPLIEARNVSELVGRLKVIVSAQKE